MRPPKLDYQRLKLANGLTVLLHQDKSTPIAHVQLWYHVGSRDERPGRTGFAHLFEHMMFKGSKNVEPEQHTSIVSSVGGQANAYTTEDATVYWQTVPAQYLPLVLWMEGDRMATLRIDDKTFRNEREVVKEERRMRIENQPYGRLNEILFDKAFTVHPYKHPVIGSMKDLEAATIDDVREFYRIVLRAGELHDRDRRRFRDRSGDRARQPVSRPRARFAQRRAARHPEGADSDARNSARRLKSRGRCRPSSSRITSPTTAIPTPIRCTSCPRCCRTGRARGFIASWSTRPASRSRRSAAATSSRIRTCFLRWPSSIPASLRPQVESALLAELDKLKTEGVTERELQRAKNQFARDYILGRESLQDKATHLAHAEVIHSDITTADGEFDIFQKISLADVQRVAKTYFTPERRVILHVMPKGGSQ